MGDVTPFKRPAPTANLKPIIGEMRDAVDAMVAAINALEEPGLFGAMSTPRRAILECLVNAWPKQPTHAELRLASGLNAAALSEHLRALRWKGWLMFESLAFAPLTEKRLIEAGILTNEIDPPCSSSADQGQSDGLDSSPKTRPVVLAIEIAPRPVAADCQGGNSQSESPVPTAALAPSIPPSAPPPPARQEARRVARPDETGRKVPEPVAHSNPAGSGIKPQYRDWMAERRQRLQRAIAYLRSQAVLVTQWDRTAAIPTYRVSGKRDLKLAEEVIEIAIAKGWQE